MTIKGGDGELSSKLVLNFDGAGLSKEGAGKLRKSLTRGQVRPSADPGTPMWCGSRIAIYDSNGEFNIAYYCGPTTRALPWGYKLSPALQAIITSKVYERGMAWWRNGAANPWNAPHVEAPDYHFHGTLQRVYAGDDVDYNDFMVFRVKTPDGTGTGSLTIAGSVALQEDA